MAAMLGKHEFEPEIVTVKAPASYGLAAIPCAGRPKTSANHQLDLD
jgi:hypothetical protein